MTDNKTMTQATQEFIASYEGIINYALKQVLDVSKMCSASEEDIKMFSQFIDLMKATKEIGMVHAEIIDRQQEMLEEQVERSKRIEHMLELLLDNDNKDEHGDPDFAPARCPWEDELESK